MTRTASRPPRRRCTRVSRRSRTRSTRRRRWLRPSRPRAPELVVRFQDSSRRLSVSMECTRRSAEPHGARSGAADGVSLDLGRSTLGGSERELGERVSLSTVYCSLIVRSHIFSLVVRRRASPSLVVVLAPRSSDCEESAKLAPPSVGFGESPIVERLLPDTEPRPGGTERARTQVRPPEIPLVASLARSLSLCSSPLVGSLAPRPALSSLRLVPVRRLYAAPPRSTGAFCHSRRAYRDLADLFLPSLDRSRSKQRCPTSLTLPMARSWPPGTRRRARTASRPVRRPSPCASSSSSSTSRPDLARLLTDNPGDMAWIMVASALVMIMAPGASSLASSPRRVLLPSLRPLTRSVGREQALPSCTLAS